MRNHWLTIFLLSLFSTSVLSQHKISVPLMDAINEAIKNNTTVRSLVMLEDQVDIAALDEQLYAQKATVHERAYKVITTLRERASATQDAIFSFLASKSSDEVAEFYGLWIANIIVVEGAPSLLFELSERTDVAFLQLDGILERDRPVSATPSMSIPNGVEPGVLAVNAHKMWEAGYTGNGVIVMNIDTGVDGNHPAINYKWRGTHVPTWQAWFDPNTNTTFPTDCDSHGSHTIGTMAGLEPATNDTIGVAFGAEWIAAKTLCSGTHTSFSIAAFQWAMDPDSNAATIDDMPIAIGNSWWDPNITGSTQCDPSQNPYIDVIAAVEAAGIAVVFSAGNSGPGTSTITTPKNVNVDEVHFWATGAVDGNIPSYPIASFSSRGPVISECITGVPSLDIKPEASAPGVSVRSAVLSGNYGLKSGTSMACPHVVGALALLKEAFPNFTGHELKMALYTTAQDLGATGEDNIYGMGIIDVWAAFLSLGVPDSPGNFSAYSDYRTQTSMVLMWDDPRNLANGDTLLPGDMTVHIRRDGILIDSVSGGTEQFEDTGLVDGQEYVYNIFVKADSSGLQSQEVEASWVAGGSPIPSGAQSFSVAGNQNLVTLWWLSPRDNVDGTPMDDYAGVNLYQNGTLVTTFSRTSADTGISDSNTYSPTTSGLYDWYLTVIDNETPQNESDPTPTLGTPLSVPIVDEFTSPGDPNSGLWINSNADVNDRAVNPPSGQHALNLNGKPIGEDIIDLKPLDLSGMQGTGIQLSYYYQPQGTGNVPEEGDSLRLYFKNDVGTWVVVRAYPGSPVQPFQQEIIDIETAPNGGGTYFHGQFQVRFRSTGGAGAVLPNDDWFVDDVYLDVPVSVDPPGILPRDYAVSRNYPNPFNPSTTIEFELPHPSDVTLKVYSLLGQEVITLVDEERPAGYFAIEWDGRNAFGNTVSSGIYFFTFEARISERQADVSSGTGEFTSLKKMILLK